MKAIQYRGVRETARQAIMQMRREINQGAKPDLAAAFALSSLDHFHIAISETGPESPGNNCRVRLLQALQIAIGQYTTDEVINAIGADQAAAYRDDWLRIMYAIRQE